MDLACNKPDAWPFGPEVPRNKPHTETKSMLTDDQCVIHAEDFFIRCMLYLPIIDTYDQKFGFGVWSSLSKENFKNYGGTADLENVEGIGPWFGWFSNSLKGYPETRNLKCDAQPRSGGLRPTIELQPADHPLSIEQREGISIDRVIEIYAKNGHEIGL